MTAFSHSHGFCRCRGLPAGQRLHMPCMSIAGVPAQHFLRGTVCGLWRLDRAGRCWRSQRPAYCQGKAPCATARARRTHFKRPADYDTSETCNFETTPFVSSFYIHLAMTCNPAAGHCTGIRHCSGAKGCHTWLQMYVCHLLMFPVLTA